ncbi:MAG: alpha/beta fold hydrolase [Alphaproteobacteria bacterium]
MPIIDTAPGVRVHYETEGSGPPLLLLSGTGHDHHFWAGQLPFFAPDFTVLTVDNRGVGRTVVPHHHYSLADMADDAAAVLDAEGIGAAHVMGFSQGGHIAQEVALRHPEKVISLGIHHSWARMCPRLRDFQTLRKLLAEKGDRDSLVRVSLLALHAPEYYRNAGDGMAAHRDFLVENSPPNEGWAGQLGACLASDTWDRLGDISVPTLVTTSRFDLTVPSYHSVEIAGAIPGAEFVMLEDTGHVALMETPEAFAQVCLDFLGRVTV